MKALVGALLLAAVGAPRAQDGVDWDAIAALSDPDERTRAAVAALEAGDAPLSGAALQAAFQLGAAEGEALRLENAARLQRALHARARAGWSAVNLALTLTRAGDYAGADAVLHAQLERTAPDDPGRAELLSRRALVALGAGDDRVALDRLGRAVAAGSTDAAVVLARHHLTNGNTRAARAGFRALLVEGDPGAWALRGWGLTLIHTERSPGTRDPASGPNTR